MRIHNLNPGGGCSELQQLGLSHEMRYLLGSGRLEIGETSIDAIGLIRLSYRCLCTQRPGSGARACATLTRPHGMDLAKLPLTPEFISS